MDKTTTTPVSQSHLSWLETLTETYAQMALAGGDQAQKQGRRDYLVQRFLELEQDFPGITAIIHTKIRAMK